MGAGTPENESGRGDGTPGLCPANQSMSTNDSAGITGTTDEPLASFEGLHFGDRLRYVGDRDTVRQLGHELTFRSLSMFGATLTLGTAFNGLLHLDADDYPAGDFVVVGR